MSLYSYKATDISGKIVKGTLEAVNEQNAANRLQDMGYIPIKISHSGKEQIQLNHNISKDVLSFFSRISNKDVMLFTRIFLLC